MAHRLGNEMERKNREIMERQRAYESNVQVCDVIVALTSAYDREEIRALPVLQVWTVAAFHVVLLITVVTQQDGTNVSCFAALTQIS